MTTRTEEQWQHINFIRSSGLEIATRPEQVWGHEFKKT
jgi:hypothetical protein